MSQNILVLALRFVYTPGQGVTGSSQPLNLPEGLIYLRVALEPIEPAAPGVASVAAGERVAELGGEIEADRCAAHLVPGRHRHRIAARSLRPIPGPRAGNKFGWHTAN